MYHSMKIHRVDLTNMKTVLLLVCIAALANQISAAPSRILCYYQNYAVYRPDGARVDVEDIDVNICTHLLYAFVGLNSDGYPETLDPSNDIGNNAFRRFTGLKSRNPNLKILASIGGGGTGTGTFSDIATDAAMRDIFAGHVVDFLLDYGFDGVDIDWEFPANGDGTRPTDYTNFVELLWALRAQLDPHGLLLTTAVAAGVYWTQVSYDVGRLRDVLDWVNLMTYDFHDSYEDYTGANSPLYAKASDSDQTLNVNSAVQNWINQGFPSDRIVLGIGAYGHTYTLADPNQNWVGAPSTGAGQPGPYLNAWGTLAYNELCQQSWTYGWDDEELIVYAYRGDQWVGFDNADSVGYKTRYAIDNNLGGLMIWAIDYDDPFALCGTYYPLINSIRNNLGWN